jgi:hypothetical protein
LHISTGDVEQRAPARAERPLDLSQWRDC